MDAEQKACLWEAQQAVAWINTYAEGPLATHDTRIKTHNIRVKMVSIFTEVNLHTREANGVRNKRPNWWMGAKEGCWDRRWRRGIWPNTAAATLRQMLHVGIPVKIPFLVAPVPMVVTVVPSPIATIGPVLISPSMGLWSKPATLRAFRRRFRGRLLVGWSLGSACRNHRLQCRSSSTISGGTTTTTAVATSTATATATFHWFLADRRHWILNRIKLWNTISWFHSRGWYQWPLWQQDTNKNPNV